VRRALLTASILGALASPALGAPDPARMVFTLRDLPAGARAFPQETGPINRAEALRDDPPALRPITRGFYLRGYESAFVAADESFLVQSTAGLYRTPASASRALVIGSRAVPSRGGTLLPGGERIVPGARLFRARTRQRGGTLETLLVVWRRGPALLTAALLGRAGTLDTGLLRRLARAQDVRARRQVGS
jgi:hypothetical protein